MGAFGKVLSSWTFWFAIFLIIALCALSYLFLGQGVESQATQGQLEKNLLIARAEKANMITFFEKFGNSVAVFAQRTSIQRQERSAIENMKTFVEQRRKMNIIAGVGILDKQGVYRLNYNASGISIVDQYTGDRDFFIWAKDHGQKGEYFISQPYIGRFGPSKGQAIISVASPLFDNGTFTGVLVSSVKLQPMLDRFLELMKASELEEEYLIDGRGNVLYSSSNPDVIGSNFSEIISSDQTLSETIENALISNSEGSLQAGSRLIAYSPITLGTQNWLIIISSPAQEVADLAAPFYIRERAALLVTAFSIMLLVMISVRKNRA